MPAPRTMAGQMGGAQPDKRRADKRQYRGTRGKRPHTAMRQATGKRRQQRRDDEKGKEHHVSPYTIRH